MQFAVLPVRGWPVSPLPGQAFLVRDNWDDYSFKTTFQLLCVDPGCEIREIGGVKIGRFGMVALPRRRCRTASRRWTEPSSRSG